MFAPDVTRYTGEAAKNFVDTAARIHADIYGEPLFENHPFFSEKLFRQRYEMALNQPRLELLTARLDGVIVGYMYGYAIRAEDGWWDAVEWSREAQDNRRDDYVLEDGTRTVVIPEILVKLQWRRRGIARLMHDKFLSGREEWRAGLRVLPHNAAAKSAYLKWGWNKVGMVRPDPRAPLYECMIKKLC